MRATFPTETHLVSCDLSGDGESEGSVTFAACQHPFLLERCQNIKLSHKRDVERSAGDDGAEILSGRRRQLQ